MKLYYLYNKSTEKLRSLKKFAAELDDLVDLTKNFMEDDVAAPIRACATRWIVHLVQTLQRAINKFGICLTDLKDFDKKGKKENKGRTFCICQQGAGLLIPTCEGILFAPVDAVERIFVGLAEEDSYTCSSRKETEKDIIRSCYIGNNMG